MSDEVNVFMDPFLKIYTNPDQIEVADSLTESFHEDIVMKEQQRNIELLESLGVVQSKLIKTMEKQPEKPKQSSSALEIVESKLKDVKERERLREKKQAETNEATVDQIKRVEMCHFDIIQTEKCLEHTAGMKPCEVTTEQQHVKEKQSDNEKQVKANETPVDQSEKAEMCHFDKIQMEKCLVEHTESAKPCEVTTEQQHVREKQSDNETQVEKEAIHTTNETTEDQSEKAEMRQFDSIQMEKCLVEHTEAAKPCAVTTEQQHVREKQSDNEKQAEANETPVDQSEKAEMCHFDSIQMEKCLVEHTESAKPCEVTTEQQHVREKQNDNEKQVEKEAIHTTNETTEDQSEKAEMRQFDSIQMEKCLVEHTEAAKPCAVTTEQQHVREKQSDNETQVEKEVIHKTNETPVDQSEKAEMHHFDSIQIEKCLVEQNEQTKAEKPCELTIEEQQQRVKSVDKEEQTKPKMSVSMTYEEAKEVSECGKSTDIHKTKQTDSVKTDHFQEPHAAIREKDFLTEKPNKTNLSEPLNKVTNKEKTEQVMEIQKQELLSGGVCPDAKKLQDDMDNVFPCKENMHLKSESTEGFLKREIVNTAPKKQEEEHVYEVPDVILTSSAEYVYETERAEEQLKKLDNVTLHIAVTGSTGAGKSSFINAIRGLEPDDINAAPTGVTETTMTSTVYTHPKLPNVKLWDLPGTGSPKFKAKKYLKEVKLDTFDFFIIISSERFKENDIMLAKAIKEKKKLFYFLRSKIDNDIQAESHRKDFDEQKVLSHIREDCHRNLKEMNDPVPKIFLISSFELYKYDFQTLVDTLKEQLPAHKREALLLSLPIYSSKILDEKIELFMKKTRSAAVASGSVAVAPVPGLSIACDAAILLAFFTRCYHAFGLDDESIDKLSVRVNNPSLKSVRKSPLVIAVGQKKLSNKELSALTNREAAVKFAWSMVPVVGSKKTAEMSYSATLNLLRAGVQDLADTAKEVLKVAGLTNVY